jgi:hypothetical protein
MMSHMFWKTVGLGVLAVLTFDTAASLASLYFGFSYGSAAVGSVLIYTFIGYRVFRHGGLLAAVVAALLVELVDATLGWYISWQIGPGAIPRDQVTVSAIATTVALVHIFAAVCALFGSGIARALHGPRDAT